MSIFYMRKRNNNSANKDQNNRKKAKFVKRNVVIKKIF